MGRRATMAMPTLRAIIGPHTTRLSGLEGRGGIETLERLIESWRGLGKELKGWEAPTIEFEMDVTVGTALLPEGLLREERPDGVLVRLAGCTLMIGKPLGPAEDGARIHDLRLFAEDEEGENEGESRRPPIAEHRRITIGPSRGLFAWMGKPQTFAVACGREGYERAMAMVEDLVVVEDRAGYRIVFNDDNPFPNVEILGERRTPLTAREGMAFDHFGAVLCTSFACCDFTMMDFDVEMPRSAALRAARRAKGAGRDRLQDWLRRERAGDALVAAFDAERAA